MISNFNYYRQIENPDMYLCNPDKRFISAVNATNRHLVLRFNDLSDLTFTVYKNTSKEEDYNRIETKRLLFVDKIGWFKIETVEENSDGAQEYKSVTAKSQQCVFKDRGFYVENRVYMFYNPKDPTDSSYDSNDTSAMPSIVGQLYQQLGIKCALHLSEPTITEDYSAWTIVWIDSDLKYDLTANDNICRSFDENTTYGYDFMINDVEKAFGVIFDFDILHHTIKVKFTESLTKKTNIYLSFDNVVNTLGLKENSEDIVTVLSCNGKDLDIRTVNPMGTNYICNFDYYKKTVSDDGLIPYPWMSQDLIGALNDWKEVFDSWKSDDNSRTGHTKSYSNVVLDLQALYIQETKHSEELQKANLILLDLSHARDQFSTAAESDKDDFAVLPIIVETVNVGEKSKLGANIGASSFYSTAFQENSSITAYTSAPTLTSTGDGYDDFEYAFSGTGTTGTAKSMIQNFIDSDSDTANLTVPFYFIDDSSSRSYCKLNISSVVDVAVDENGIAMQFEVDDAGTVTLNETTFTIVKTSATTYTVKVGSTTVESNVTSNGYFIYSGSRFRLVASADKFVSVYYFYVSGFDRYSAYILTTGEHGWCSIWEAYIADINDDNDDLQEDIQELLDELEYINNQCNIQTYIKNRSETLYEELQYYWIEGDYDNDNLAVLDNTSMAERIDLANELMEAGGVELEKISQPTFELSVNAIDFTKIFEFKQFTDELELGKIIIIQRNDTTHYYPALLSIELDLDTAGNFTLTFSNAFKTDETAMTIADLLNEATSTSRTISANWANLMSYSKSKDVINDLLRNPLDKTLRTMQANLANQEFSIDTTGILGRKYSDGTHTSFDKEQLRIINNVIMFTDDCWESSKLALGKVTYTENGTDKTAYGLLAEVVVGELIMGSTLKIRNQNSSLTLDYSGMQIEHRYYEECTSSTTGALLVVSNSSTPTTGQIKVEDVGITGIEAGDYVVYKNDTVFAADTNGNLTLTGTIYATAGSFSGTITSSSGTIGGFTIGANTLASTNNNVGISSVSTTGELAFWAGSNFGVTNQGILTASNATISGSITATSGSIGAFEITNDGLESQYIHLNSEQLFFPTQTQLNLNNEILIYDLASDPVTGVATSYIVTRGAKNFEIKNESGAGLRFMANAQAQTATVNLTINNPRTSTVSEYQGGGHGVSMYMNTVTLTLDFQFTGTQGATAALATAYQVEFYTEFDNGQIFGNTTVHTKRSYTIPANNSSGTISIVLYAYSSTTGTSGVTMYPSHDINHIISWTENGTYGTSLSRSIVTIDNSNTALYSLGSLFPRDTTCLLGDGSHKWGLIAAESSMITTSDKRFKNSIAELTPEYDIFFDLIKPVSYKFNNGSSGRLHTGFIAQDIEQSLIVAGLSSKDFAGLCIDETSYSLRYEEFIALNTYEIQKLKKRVIELENKLKEIQGE